MQRSRQLGLTRFELTVSVTAATLLAVLSLAWFGSGESGEQNEVARHTAKKLVTAVSDWKQQHRELGCPTVSQLIVDRAWNRSDLSDDPWGGRFLISCSAESVQVRSAGGDGEFETEDDISVDVPWNT